MWWSLYLIALCSGETNPAGQPAQSNILPDLSYTEVRHRLSQTVHSTPTLKFLRSRNWIFSHRPKISTCEKSRIHFRIRNKHNSPNYYCLTTLGYIWLVTHSKHLTCLLITAPEWHQDLKMKQSRTTKKQVNNNIVIVLMTTIQFATSGKSRQPEVIVPANSTESNTHPMD